jgi:hypothetical protein
VLGLGLGLLPPTVPLLPWLAPAPVALPLDGFVAVLPAEPDLTFVLLLAAVPALGFVD